MKLDFKNMFSDCTAYLCHVLLCPTAGRRAFKSLQAQPVVRVLVAQASKDEPRGLRSASGGHAEQPHSRLLRSHRDGAGERGGGRRERPACRQEELRGEGSVKRTIAHDCTVDGSITNQQFKIQEHART